MPAAAPNWPTWVPRGARRGALAGEVDAGGEAAAADAVGAASGSELASDVAGASSCTGCTDDELYHAGGQSTCTAPPAGCSTDGAEPAGGSTGAAAAVSQYASLQSIIVRHAASHAAQTVSEAVSAHVLGVPLALLTYSVHEESESAIVLSSTYSLRVERRSLSSIFAAFLVGSVCVFCVFPQSVPQLV